MNHKVLILAVAGALTLGACTTSERVSIQQPGDLRLSCAEIESEFAEIEEVMEDAQGDKGVNTANVAAIVFFWPAAVGNYMGAEAALDAAEERQEWLFELYERNECAGEL